MNGKDGKGKGPPPPSIFRRAKPMPLPGSNPLEQLLALARTHNDTPLQLRKILKQILKQARAGRRDPNVEGGREYYDRIRVGIRATGMAMAAGDMQRAVIEAVLVTQAWMELRWDALDAPLYLEKKNRTPPPSLSDEDLARAAVRLGNGETQAAVSADLGITERWLRVKLARWRSRQDRNT
jgi:hypothetical protein